MLVFGDTLWRRHLTTVLSVSWRKIQFQVISVFCLKCLSPKLHLHAKKYKMMTRFSDSSIIWDQPKKMAMRKNITIRMTTHSSAHFHVRQLPCQSSQWGAETNSSKELVNAPEVVAAADWSTIYSANLQLGLNHSLWGSNSPLRCSLYRVHTHFDCFLLSLFLQN